MKARFALLFVFATILVGHCQVAITPKISINSTRYLGAYSGGPYLGLGVEAEKRFWQSKKARRSEWSVLSGVGYLQNGGAFNLHQIVANHNMYTISSISSNYFQIPLEVKYTWQPYPLIKHLKLFGGLGLTGNFVLNSTLSEKTNSTSAVAAVIIDGHFTSRAIFFESSDQRDITNDGSKFIPFIRYEIGASYKSFQISLRWQRSLTDVYRSGVEKNWGIPEKQSHYISTHNGSYLGGSGVVMPYIEKYFEITFGWQINYEIDRE